MAADDFGIDTVTTETATSSWANTLQTNLQDEFERRWSEHEAESYVISGLTPTIDSGNDEIDVAAGIGYASGKRWLGDESLAFTTEATDTYYIYWDPSDETLKKVIDGTGWPATAHIRVCEVLWTLGTTTLSALVDTSLSYRRKGLFVPVDVMTPDGTNPPVGPSTGGTAGQSQYRYLGFDDAADDIVHFQIPTPEDYNGHLHVWVPFLMPAATAGDIYWKGTLLAVAVGEAIDAAGGVNQNGALGNVTVPGTAGLLAWGILDFGNITIAREDLLSFMLYRDESAETSSPAEDAHLVAGVWITYA